MPQARSLLCPTTQELCTNERCDGAPCALKVATKVEKVWWDAIFDWGETLLDIVLGKGKNSD